MIDTTRQSGIIPDDSLNDVSVAVIGVGAIGSHTVESLSKMGIRDFHIFDDDIVEVHNLANQGYFLPEIGYKKVEALAIRISKGTGASVTPEACRVENNHEFNERYVISAVDNMKSRKSIFESFLNSYKSRFFLDGRMAARFGQVFFVDKLDPETIEKYEASLFSDEEAVPLPCTEKATIFCAYGIASFMSALIAKSIIEEPIKFTAAELDFANVLLTQAL